MTGPAGMRVSALSVALMLLASCGGGGGGGSNPPPPPTPTPPVTRLYAVPAAEALSVADVERVVAQGVVEAQARALPSVIAVTDRVGNVLAVYRMTGARATATTSAAGNPTANSAATGRWRVPLP